MAAVSPPPLQPHQYERLDQLVAAAGVAPDELPDHAQVMLHWLASWGPDTVEGMCELLKAARGVRAPQVWHVALLGLDHVVEAEGACPLTGGLLAPGGELLLRLDNADGVYAQLRFTAVDETVDPYATTPRDEAEAAEFRERGQ